MRTERFKGALLLVLITFSLLALASPANEVSASSNDLLPHDSTLIQAQQQSEFYPTIIESYSLEDIISNPFGLAWDGNNLWSIKKTDARGPVTMFKHGDNPAIILYESEAPGDGHGITWDGNNIWVSSPSRIYRLNGINASNYDEIEPSESILPPGVFLNSFEGLTWRDGYLWILREDSPRADIFQMDPDSGNVISHFHLDGVGYSASLEWDPDRQVFWLGGATGSDVIYKLNGSDPSVIENTYLVQGLEGADGLAYDGTYLWAVCERDQMFYQIQISSTPPPPQPPGDDYEPDNTPQQAKPISLGETQQHSIVPVGDVDWVKFTLDSRSDITVETSRSSGDTEMWLYDSGLNQIAYDDDSGESTLSKITSTLDAGAYYVKVAEYGDEERILAYSLSLTVLPTEESEFYPTIIESYSLEDVISNPHGLAWDGNNLWSIKKTDARGPVTMFKHRAGNPAIILQESEAPGDGHGITWDGNNIWVSSPSRVYRLNGINASNYDEIEPSESILPPGVFLNSFEGLTWRDGYLWILREDSPNANIFKMDPSGNVISSFSLSGIGELVSSLEWDPDRQVFWLGKWGSNVIYKLNGSDPSIIENAYAVQGLVGADGLAYDGTCLWAICESPVTLYKIQISSTPPPPPPPAGDDYEPDDTYQQVNPISLGETQQHSIDPVGDVDWVKFTLNARSDIAIETSRSSGDTEIWLYDSGLNQIAYDDDSGESTLSKITSTLNAGTYYVKVGEHGDDERILAYSLSLTIPTQANRPPNTPSNLSPQDGATDQPTSLTLSWTGGDPDGDPVVYYLYFGAIGSSPSTIGPLTTTSYPISGLSQGTTYGWWIVASDGMEDTPGGLWEFTTVTLEQNASITSFIPPSYSFSRGDQTTSYITIKNTGTLTRSFWIGLSFQKPNGDWYDVLPKQTDTLSPNAEESLTLDWTIPSDAPAGSYTAWTAVWNGYDSSANAMVEPKYDERLVTDAFTVQTALITVEITSLTTNKTQYGVDEPVMIEFTVKNGSSMRLHLRAVIEIKNPYNVSVYDSHLSGEDKELWLNPGETTTVTFRWEVPLYFEHNTLTYISEPGDYQMHASLRDWDDWNVIYDYRWGRRLGPTFYLKPITYETDNATIIYLGCIPAEVKEDLLGEALLFGISTAFGEAVRAVAGALGGLMASAVITFLLTIPVGNPPPQLDVYLVHNSDFVKRSEAILGEPIYIAIMLDTGTRPGSDTIVKVEKKEGVFKKREVSSFVISDPIQEGFSGCSTILVKKPIIFSEEGIYSIKALYAEAIGEAEVEAKPGAIMGSVNVESKERTGEIVVGEEVYIPEVQIETEASPNKVVVRVSSDMPEGRTVVINIDNNVLPVLEPDEVTVLFDGKEIGIADDYADVLDPTNEEVPEYLVVVGAKGTQVLVSIPRFSTHTIEITRRGEKIPPVAGLSTPMILLVAAAAIVLILAVFIRRRPERPKEVRKRVKGKAQRARPARLTRRAK